MAKYQITHSCGHTQEHVLYGKHSGYNGRDNKIEWLGTTLCKECWKKEQDNKKEKVNQEAAEKVNENGFIELQGSEKQIAWANTIRQEKWDEIQKRWGDKPHDNKPILNVFNVVINASEWIENRNENAVSWLSKIAKKHGLDK